jgi:tRNA threonylcarbamoyl adenosine modification protein YeaZ
VTGRPILSFDTAGPWCAAAVLDGAGVLARAEPMERGQAERLMPMLVEMLAEAGVGWRGLAAIGCGVGPGNFTGVRISVATARSLALALGVPAVGVTLFEAVAEGLPLPCLVALDARRGESYVQRFGLGDGAAALVPEGTTVPLEGLAAVTGSAGWLDDVTGPERREMPAPEAIAAAIARLAGARLAGGEAPAPPAPLYLRPADAAPPRDPPPVILP